MARKWFDLSGWRFALATAALAPVVLTFFLATLGFGGFEATLSLLLQDAFLLAERQATNQQIAAEVFLSVDRVKAHLRILFEKFGVTELPQNRKRLELVQRALLSGLVTLGDL